MEDRIEVAAMALSRSGNMIVTTKDGCTVDDLLACRDMWMSSAVKGYRKAEKWAMLHLWD